MILCLGGFEFIVVNKSFNMLFSVIGRGAELRLQFCQTLKEQFQFSWRMISLVDVILRYAKEDQVEAWRQIDEGAYNFVLYHSN